MKHHAIIATLRIDAMFAEDFWLFDFYFWVDAMLSLTRTLGWMFLSGAALLIVCFALGAGMIYSVTLGLLKPTSGEVEGTQQPAAH